MCVRTRLCGYVSVCACGCAHASVCAYVSVCVCTCLCMCCVCVHAGPCGVAKIDIQYTCKTNTSVLLNIDITINTLPHHYTLYVIATV